MEGKRAVLPFLGRIGVIGVIGIIGRLHLIIYYIRVNAKQ